MCPKLGLGRFEFGVLVCLADRRLSLLHPRFAADGPGNADQFRAGGNLGRGIPQSSNQVDDLRELGCLRRDPFGQTSNPLDPKVLHDLFHAVGLRRIVHTRIERGQQPTLQSISEHVSVLSVCYQGAVFMREQPKRCVLVRNRWIYLPIRWLCHPLDEARNERRQNPNPQSRLKAGDRFEQSGLVGLLPTLEPYVLTSARSHRYQRCGCLDSEIEPILVMRQYRCKLPRSVQGICPTVNVFLGRCAAQQCRCCGGAQQQN